MARIPNDEVERLKREVSLVRLAEARGLELKKHGENVIGRCPFHADKTPSFVITPSKNLWHCLGACQAGGTVIDFVMRVEGVSFRLAAELLRKELPSLAAAGSAARAAERTAYGPKLEPIAEVEEADGVVLGRVCDYYHATLKESPEALSYLSSRGLEQAEMLSHFQLGFANRTLGYRLPSKKVLAGAAQRGQLQRLGLMRESGHEHFTGSLTIPLFDAQGAVVGMYGRKIRNDLRPGTPLHMYLPGPHRGIFNRNVFEAEREIILCEALIDALTFWCAGFRGVTSAYGVEGFTPELREAFGSHDVKRVLIAYDRDEAGEKAAAKLAPELSALGLTVYRVHFPKGMDANEYAQRVKPSAKSLDAVIRAATWMAGTRAVQVPEAIVSEPIPPLAASPEAEGVLEEEATSAVAVQEAAPAAAAPAAAAAPSEAAATPQHEGELTLQFGPRTWRIRGLEKNTSLASIKVTIRVTRGALFFTDTLDVASARARGAFLKQAREELEEEERVLKADLGRVILTLEERVEAQLKEKLTPKPSAPTLSEAERAEALALLKDPKLFERILADFERCGVVGEETNKLVGYLAAVSRKLETPLAVLIQSSSAAGKSSLMEAILRFVPQEEQVAYSAMTGQSLFYMGATDLQHKVLAIAEEEGATNAAYALKLLQSSGELTIASTGKDPATGRHQTHEYRVQGPVMVMLTTTSIEIDEELLNRCVVLTVDEGREQTRAIQRLQREARTLEGLMAKQHRGHVMALHQNAQRLLRAVHVVNPYAGELSFADHATRARRDHAKYLTVIDTIALLHQHQRAVKTAELSGGSTLRYIEVTREDIALADKLCGQVLARGLDELSPQTRSLLSLAGELVHKLSAEQGIEPRDARFTQRELRDFASWSATQVKVQLQRLVELEYVTAHGHREHRQRLLYALSFGYDVNRSASKGNRSETGPGENGPVFASNIGSVHSLVRDSGESDTGPRMNGQSYAQTRVRKASAN